MCIFRLAFVILLRNIPLLTFYPVGLFFDLISRAENFRFLAIPHRVELVNGREINHAT